MPKKKILGIRFGIAELFGLQIDLISKKERDVLLRHALSGSTSKYPECPFRLPDKKGSKQCVKRGGVCSIRRYRNVDGLAERISGFEGTLTVICPNRFHQDKEVFKWVGEHLLGIENSEDLALSKEVYFLERPTFESGKSAEDEIKDEKEVEGEDVGRIDLVLVDRRSLDADSLRWCALEIQAVYFSGKKMRSLFELILDHKGESIPFPDAVRRPDYRSSGPKRLMPQLQIKVPTLRRWGKKMAVVVDAHFFGWMGDMEEVEHVSNCDIAWFVTEFDEKDVRAKLRRGKVSYTTLERAVDGLTGGNPVSLPLFERRVKERILRKEEEET